MGEKLSLVAAIIVICLAMLLIAIGLSEVAVAYPAGWTSDVLVDNAYQSVDVASWGDTVLVVWKDGDGHVKYKRSTNGGIQWSDASRIDRSSSECFDPQVAMNGNIAYIAYKTRNEPRDINPILPADRDYVVVKRSDDGGKVFNNQDPDRHVSRGTWYAITPPSRSVNNFDLDRCLTTEPFLLAYQEDNNNSHVKRGWFHNVGVMTADGSNPGIQIPTQAGGRAVLCPAISGAGANEYYVSFVERNWESSPGEVVVAARFLDGQGWSDWDQHPPGQKVVPLNDYSGHEKLRDIDISCNHGAHMRVVWDDTSSGKHALKLRVLDTNQALGLSLIRSVDHSPYPKSCRGRDFRVYRGQNSGDGRRYLRDVSDDRMLMDLELASQENFNTLSVDCDGRAASRTYLAGTRQGDGRVFLKRTDTVAPTSDPIKVNGRAPVTNPTYFRSDFPLTLTNVKDPDWNTTGKDITSKFNNGVTSVVFKRAGKAKPGTWTSLKTVNATGSSGLSWAATVDVSATGDGRYYFKGTMTDTAGNISDSTPSGEIVIDTVPPDTNLKLSGVAGDNSWFKSDVTATLNPIDSFELAETKCRIRNLLTGTDGEWNTYGGPFILGEGEWAIEYYSLDKAGNTEECKEAVVRIDKTAPNTVILTPEKDAIQTGFEAKQVIVVSGTGTDSGSGMASEVLLKNGIPMGTEKTSAFNLSICADWDVGREEAGVYELVLSARDKAGNIGTTSRRISLDSFARDWYLAEGNTLPDFKEYLCIINPGDEAARVRLEFMLEDGNVVVPATHIVAPHTRATMDVKDFVQEGHSGVSTKVHCDNQAIVVERPMYFHYKASDPGRNWKGGHIARGINTLQKQYYFAEGSTRQAGNGGPFDEWLTIQNPGGTAANVTIFYMLGDGSNISKYYYVGPHSRTTVNVNIDVGPDKDVSAKVVSDVPIAAERPQYQSYRGYAVDGHNVVGASSPAKRWHFAEGTTKNGFEQYITLQNPGDIPANVTMTYMNGEGKVTTTRKRVEPRSRGTVTVLNDVGDGQDISTSVDSDQPIVAERPIYFDYKMKWDGASVAMGETTAYRTLYIAEGCTQGDMDTYFCIQNTNASPANIVITYLLGDGTPVKRGFQVAKRSRLTICALSP